MQVKTPWPAITVGLDHDVVVAAMMTHGATKGVLSTFLKDLQVQKLLCSSPAVDYPPVRFPFMVVEAKSYTTSKPIFVAQNQASVSGSCMTNLQHKLVNLTRRPSPTYFGYEAPVAFSIGNEGPYFELWVHYTTMCADVRDFNMNIVATCHASLLPGVVEFLIKVDSIVSWAADTFVDKMADQLALLLSKCAR